MAAIRTAVSEEECNRFHVLWFDPGSRATGWARIVLHYKAFSRPEHDWERYIEWWDSGELSGTEFEILDQASRLISGVSFEAGYRCVIGSEDFDNVQTVGSAENLLSPVRQNSVLGWECYKRNKELVLQRRNMRTSVTRDRLRIWGFEGKFRKDEFAAMQHGIAWVRRTKQTANRIPWRLNTPSYVSAYWDCRCARGRKCNLIHPAEPNLVPRPAETKIVTKL